MAPFCPQPKLFAVLNLFCFVFYSSFSFLLGRDKYLNIGIGGETKTQRRNAMNKEALKRQYTLLDNRCKIKQNGKIEKKETHTKTNESLSRIFNGWNQIGTCRGLTADYVHIPIALNIFPFLCIMHAT